MNSTVKPVSPVMLSVTAGICGAFVMVLEVLGARVLGPFFGASLFVWTSLITVTLLALAGGYVLGGSLADRYEKPGVLFGIILGAGLLVLVIPWAKGPVLRACAPLGLRVGSLLSATLLFGPALVALGCVSPFIVKLAAHGPGRLGRTVGGLYAISTLGSFLGTVGTGFVLIAHFTLVQILQFTAVCLIANAAVYFAFARKQALYLLLMLAALVAPARGHPAFTMPGGTRVEELYAKDTFYGSLRVVDYRYGAAHTRELMIDGLIQGGLDMVTRQSVYPYPYLLAFVPTALNPDGQRCLVVGLGAGLLPIWYEARGYTTDVVEIDPDVVAAAKEYFGLQISGEFIVGDARHYLRSATRNYDFVLLDVFTGDSTPGHLLSREALGEAKARLAPGGVLGMNFIGNLHDDARMTGSVLKTLRSVFDHVVVYAVNPEAPVTNFAFLAYDGALREIVPEEFAGYVIYGPTAAEVKQALTQALEVADDPTSFIITDDYNPIDFYAVRTREALRAGVLTGVDWSFLL